MARTYDSQLGAVGGPSGGILPVASIIAGVAGRHTLDGEDTAAAAHLGDEDVLVLVIEERLIVERPANIQGQIALREGALVGYVLAKVRGLRARGKGRDLGQDLRELENKNKPNQRKAKPKTILL